MVRATYDRAFEALISSTRRLQLSSTTHGGGGLDSRANRPNALQNQQHKVGGMRKNLLQNVLDVPWDRGPKPDPGCRARAQPAP